MRQVTKTVRAVKVSHKVTVRAGSKSRTVERSRVTRQERVTKSDGGLTVTLPEVPGIPAQQRGTSYTIPSLLTKGEDNPKLAKSDAASAEYRTFGLTLSPSTESGFQTCASASAGCRAVCLNFQGMGRVFPSIHVSRIAKTVAFFVHRERFLSVLRAELRRIAKRARREGWVPAVRLNVLSDIPWERVAPELFAEFPGVQFYDYTKHSARMLRFCAGDFPGNYHLTFSRSECNHADCLRVLAAGGTVAVVFSDANLPATWEGHPVIGGDETDMRFTDAPGSVVGLYAKGTARRDDSGFVVPTRRIALSVLS
jgi:hypothetical protein